MNKSGLFFNVLGSLIALSWLAVPAVKAQDADSLLRSMDTLSKSEPVQAVFKATRIVLSHSTETQKKHDLDLRIRHHFGDIGGRFGSAHTLYGLDVASDLFIGLDYGVTDDFTVAVGRSKQDETFNFSGKYKLLKQQDTGMPVNLTLLAQMGWVAREPFNENEFTSYADRFSWFFQGLISRKLTSRLSLQVMPGYLIRQVSMEPGDPRNLFVLGFAGRMKLTKRLSFVADYTLVNGLSRQPDNLANAYYDPLGVGLEIETGGHIFSLNFMNSEYILENNFIPNTKKSWGKGGVRFGFTISRNFSLFKSKDPGKQSKIY
ncbi:DUF5777 family beta-barrel protein [Pedobacter sp. JY14-1]|uniref:DUF5777 family beta-barrel protein n=1 Tax=Pedobacter sp. JY14-1 TaxID=3034151 RepID=UPI0023E17BCB|nr:DUF5777 family beta-barrel protein [Pedobacter sp. JY14-1]